MQNWQIKLKNSCDRKIETKHFEQYLNIKFYLKHNVLYSYRKLPYTISSIDIRNVETRDESTNEYILKTNDRCKQWHFNNLKTKIR